MKNNKTEVLETNPYVTLYEDDIFRQSRKSYEELLDKKTLKEHERQLKRI